MEDNKTKALQFALSQIEKAHGKGSIMKLGDNPVNEIEAPCTELWRRIFVWWDGRVNPCDYDYKSYLSEWDMKDNNISEIWNSDNYNDMREMHLNSKRSNLNPCRSCIST